MFKIKLPSFLPKEDKFCALLEDLARESGSCARHLKTYVDSHDDKGRSDAAQAIADSRAEAKRIATGITRELCLTFITPFDREDIQALADNLYKIPKTIQKVIERLDLHNLRSADNDFAPQVELILQEAGAMETIIGDMTRRRNSAQIQGLVAFLYDLEHRGDAVLGTLLKALFGGTRDARDLILRKDIYDMLEKIIDRYRDSAGIALQIVLKHS